MVVAGMGNPFLRRAFFAKKKPAGRKKTLESEIPRVLSVALATMSSIIGCSSTMPLWKERTSQN